jgi:hypothetical protein
VSWLAEHLDDEHDPVRDHLCTTLVAIGSEHPTKLTDARAALVARLTDGSPYVRGRAAEALGPIVRSGAVDAAPAVDEVEPGADDGRPFAAERVAVRAWRPSGGRPRRRRERRVDPARDRRGRRGDHLVRRGEGPHRGLGLPEGGSPIRPRCGAPR